MKGKTYAPKSRREFQAGNGSPRGTLSLVSSSEALHGPSRFYKTLRAELKPTDSTLGAGHLNGRSFGTNLDNN